MNQPLRYQVDANFRICDANPAWHRFYKKNGDGRSPTAFIGDTIFQHIDSAELQDLYGRIFKTVSRTRNPMEFPFRCDSPDFKRELEMKISPLENGGFEFQTRTICLKRWPGRANGPLEWPSIVSICSWCDRIKLNGEWTVLPQALGLLKSPPADASGAPRITHGICPDCKAKVMRQVMR